MPIYEFHCPANNRIYSFFARTLAYAGKVPRCPDNPKFPLERVLSRFSVGTQSSHAAEGEQGLSDPRVEAGMAEIEREMSSMNEANPDPRQLARMMRKMSDLTGEQMPGSMNEMIRRLEAGEDPEKLEEEMAGVPEEDLLPGGDGALDAVVSTGGRRRSIRRQTRDPKLYDIADYVD